MKAKKRRLSPRKLLKIRRKEKDPAVRDRIMLNVHIERDGMSMSMAARHLGMAPSWGVKWRRRYLEEGIRGLQTRSRSGRPPWIPKETMKKVRKTARDMRSDPLLFFKPAHPTFQARFRQAACSASHSNLWFTNPHTTSLIRSYFFSGFRYTPPIIRQVLTLRMACST